VEGLEKGFCIRSNRPLPGSIGLARNLPTAPHRKQSLIACLPFASVHPV
jgi:hypothetical protein